MSRRYEPGTNVLETAWMTGSGWVTVRDFLTFGDWRPDNDFEPHRRPPPDDEAEHVLVRMVECLQGEVDIEMICQPAFDYGSTRVDWERRGDSGTDAEVTHDGLHLILTGDLGLGVDGGDARARHRMKAGEVRFSALSWGPSPIPPASSEDCQQRRERTIDFWRRWLEGGSFPDHPWRAPLQRSALVLKGLTYSPTGALIAALTTSLPETPGGERNWDYRYTWIRDATFTLWSLHTLGLDYEATDFMGWLTDIYQENVDVGQYGMQIMYGIRGEKDLTETTLDELSGYEGADPRPHRQRRLQPAPERRLRRAAGLGLHPREGPGPSPPRALGRALPPGGDRDLGLGEARPGNLGGSGRPEALRHLEADVLGRGRSRLSPG